ncbi:MAG: ATP-binding protein [Deltaproteobacteria bacterium]|nr:ATP-binding protein [Deltaproteobacteria bacterium]
MERDALKRLYRRCDPSEAISPEDDRYVVFEPELRGDDWTARVHRSITRSVEPTCTLLSGPPGCGKSTELRRLVHMFRQGTDGESGYFPVLIDAGDFSDLSGQINAAAMLTGIVHHTGHRVLEAVGEGPDKVPLKDYTYAFESQFQLRAEGSGDALVFEQFLEQIRATLFECMRRVGKPLVVIVDSLNTIQGESATWAAVLRSAEQFFRAAPRFRLPVHVVYTVPPGLLTRNVPGIDFMPMIRVRERGRPAPCAPGIDALRELVRRRISDAALHVLLGEHHESRIRQAIQWSAGSPRALLLILREVLVSAEFPLSGSSWSRVQSEIFDQYVPLVYSKDLGLLAQIHASGYLSLDHADELDTLARLLETNLLSYYRNSESWFDVNPAMLELPHFQRRSSVRKVMMCSRRRDRLRVGGRGPRFRPRPSFACCG